MQACNIDSKLDSVGFHYCAIALQQRVLQHIPSESGHSSVQLACPLWANSGHLRTLSNMRKPVDLAVLVKRQ